jgi:glutaredoxin
MPPKLKLDVVNARLSERGFMLVGEYVNANTHTLFRCSKGHEWPAQPRYIINSGFGCPHCAGNVKLTKSDIEKRLEGRGIRLVGDQVGLRNKVTFACDYGHEWNAEINTVLNHRSGCPHCAKNAKLDAVVINERLKPRGIQMIGPYQGTKNKSSFKCDMGHEWEVGLASVLGGNGCPTCNIDSQRYTTKEFIKLAKAVHGERYDYSKVNYFNAKNKVEIVCKKHGPFWLLPLNHIQGHRSGCKECVFDSLRLTTEEFIQKSRLRHGDKYDYSKVEYKTNHDKVELICREHGSFWQMPMNHIKETGCPGCAVTGFDQTKPGILYYLAVLTDNNETLYKIGITNLSVHRRFPKMDLERIRTLQTWSFERGEEAAKREESILREFADDQYLGPTVLVGAGNTELFVRDVLGLDDRVGLKYFEQWTQESFDLSDDLNRNLDS